MRNTALFGAVFLVVADRLLKTIAPRLWNEATDSLISLTFARNTGVAFSFDLRLDPLWLIIPILCLVAVLAIRSLRRREVAQTIAYGYIFLGAASNLYDRIAYGFVIDYINFSFFSVFNLADVLIIGGAA